MDACDIEQIFDADLSIEQDVKTPRTEEICAGIEKKAGNKVNRINICKSDEDLLSIDLS